MRVKLGFLEVRTIGTEDKETLARWAEKLRPQWGDNALDQLMCAEHRIGAYLPDEKYPVGFAGITPDGGPNDLDRGAMWFDFLYVEPRHRGRRLQEVLYDHGQIPYAKGHSGRRILRIPLSPAVVKFSTARGWKKVRDLPDTSYINGVYELPRDRLPA
jgi:GNAT superfamily N-acetyltransferase